jgi:signal transduction histidine kinase
MIDRILQYIKANILNQIHYDDEQRSKDALMRKIALFWIFPTFLFLLLFFFSGLYLSAFNLFLICVNHILCIYLSTKGYSKIPRFLETVIPSFLIFILACVEFPVTDKMKLLLIILNLSLISFSFIFFSIKEWIYIAIGAGLIFVYGSIYEFVGPLMFRGGENVLVQSFAFETAIYILSIGMLSVCIFTFKRMLENQVKSIQDLLKQTSKQNQEIASQRDEIEEKAASLSYALEELTSTQEEIVAQRDAIEEKAQNLAQALELLEQSQDKLIASEKMVALGQMIAGVAHEINTPLGAIRSSAGILTTTLEQILGKLPNFFTMMTLEEKNIFYILINKSIQSNNALTSKEERVIKRTLISNLEDLKIDNADEFADTFVDIGIYESIDEYSTILTSKNNLEIMQMAYKISSLLRCSRTINIGSERAGKVVHALKNYAHVNQSGAKSEGNIVESVETVLTLYYNQIKQNVKLIKHIDDDIPVILCYPDELNQVWTNLVHNALQAMNNKGTLTIAITKDLENITVSVSDSGKGIPDEIKNKIFQPFFTTKVQGEGSGLGLDIVKRIIEKHDGTIGFESVPGNTTFTVTIPIKLN